MMVEEYREIFLEMVHEYATDSTIEQWSVDEYRKQCYQDAARRFIGLYGLDAWKSLGYSKQGLYGANKGLKLSFEGRQKHDYQHGKRKRVSKGKRQTL